MELIDIGVNLTAKQFAGHRDAVVQRAQQAGVRRQVVTGTSERASREAAELASSHPGQLYATAGVHPHDAKSVTDATWPLIRELADQGGVVAIGECGLDFNRDFSPRPVQERVFEQHLELAAELGMPVFLHERDAHARFVTILAAWLDRLPGAVVHCFTGPDAELDRYLEMGCHIGITGWICDERRGLHLREAVKRIPADRMMLETDAPWLTPRDLRPRPKRNEPRFLPHIAGVVAECVGKPVEQVAAETTAVAERFFGL